MLILILLLFYLIAIIDTKTHEIPPYLTLLISFLALLRIHPASVVFGFIFAFIFNSIIMIISHLSNQYIMGGGDAKLMFPFFALLAHFNFILGLLVFAIFIGIISLMFKPSKYAPLGAAFCGTYGVMFLLYL